MKATRARKPHVLHRPWVLVVCALAVAVSFAQLHAYQNNWSYPSDPNAERVYAPIGARAAATPSSQGIYK